MKTKMKILLNSYDLTEIIKDAVIFKRNHFANEIRETNLLSDFNQKDKDLIIFWAQNEIDNCNMVLDKMNVND